VWNTALATHAGFTPRYVALHLFAEFLLAFGVRRKSEKCCDDYGDYNYDDFLMEYEIGGICEYGNEPSASIKCGKFID